MIAKLGIQFVSRASGAFAVLFFVTSCATRDTAHRVLISVPEQKMAVLEKGVPIATYPVSTSKFGLGDYRGSWGTPLGKLEVASKIGDAAPLGAVFKDRRFTGEVIAVDAPGRDPIVTRILWLRGRESQNQNAYRRFIYIHGTPEERNIGLPVSYGCVRMRSSDIIQLYDTSVSVLRSRLLIPHYTRWLRRFCRQAGVWRC